MPPVTAAFRRILLAGLSCVVLGLAPGFAQTAPPDQMKNEAPAATERPATRDDNASGSAPKDMGSTGWTGPHKGEQTGTDRDASDQPSTATGADLKGPPRQFPPNKTPE